MNLHTRNGIILDKEWLYSLYCITMKTHVEKTWGWDEDFQKNAFETHLRPDRFHIVMKSSIDAGAYLIYDKGDHLWLEMLLVNPELQNQGIGSWVIRKLQNKSKQANIPLKLSVIKVNPVQSFYKSLGFSIYDEDDSFYKMEWSHNKPK